MNPECYESYRKLINVEPNGRKKEYTFCSPSKKEVDKVTSLYSLRPPARKARSTLRLGDNMWFYIPNVGKPIRILSLQSVVGGVFNNADILSSSTNAAEYAVEKVKENRKRLSAVSSRQRQRPWRTTGSNCMPTEKGSFR